MNPTSQNKKLRIVLKITAALIVVAICSIAGYAYGTTKQSNNAATGTSKSTNSTQQTAQPQASFHTVIETGYPFGTNLKVATKLGIPNNLQAISISSNIENPGYTSLLANKFNAEMGRWIFGRPTISDAGQAGDISIIHIEESWINAPSNSDADERQDEIIGLAGNANSVQKKAFLAKIISDTSSCATDPKRGFVIDKKMNICYEVVHRPQSTESYYPKLYIRGYAKINDQSFVMAGYFELNEDDNAKYTGAQQDAFTREFASGNVPAHTQATATKYIDALKQTTITASNK